MYVGVILRSVTIVLQKRRGQPYSLVSRQLASGAKIYYARFREADGSFGSAKSTGVEDTGKPRSRDLAVSWCEQYLAGGQVTTGANTTLADYGTGFFDWSGDYAQERILRGRRYSQEQARLHALAFDNWIKDDKIGKMRLEAIDDRAVASWQLRLAAAGLAPKTIHQRTMTLRLVLKAAFRDGHLRRPIQYEPISGKVKNQRGVLTMQEAAVIFAEPWPDARAMAGNLLAVTTGLRAGEICGLRTSRVQADHVEVVGTWRPKTGIVSDTTKGGGSRRVPAPAAVISMLQALILANPWRGRVADPFVFWSNGSQDRAMDQRDLTKALHDRIDQVIGVDAWRVRHIGMHSWRAFANTALLEAAVPSAMIRHTIGHTSDAMTALYYRPQAMAPIRQVQDGIAAALGLPEPDQVDD
jgi:integrase